MKEYFFSLLTASVLVTVLGMLLPNGALTKHMRFFCSLFLICTILILPQLLSERVTEWRENGFSLSFDREEAKYDYERQLDEALRQTSEDYFRTALIQLLEQEFSIAAGNVDCRIQWQTTEDRDLSPKHITVLLSGSAVWKDSGRIQEYVSGLLSCECSVAIE